ncbi:MAG: aminopeptidase P N-terminal domain-containing protein [Gemmatimonadota bacterium]|nr:aminopeptidase P N-terminal domain-containing protein [Gemmatimonadota bacterium]MDH3423974.1 aminopeptidase P N-terminal domain-containing protein [Gemmatimonadota bacterium]
MRRVTVLRLLLALLLVPGALQAQVAEAPVRYETDFLSADFHAGRREAVRRALPRDGLALLFGAPVRNRSADTSFEYRQSSDLRYLTGSTEPGTVLLLAPGGVVVDGRTVREVLFVPPRDPSQEVWDGRRFGTERAMAQLGVELAVESTRFNEIVVPLLRDANHPLFHLPLPVGVEPRTALAAQLEVFLAHVQPADPRGGTPPAGARTSDPTLLRGVVDRLREIKTDDEMVLLRRAIDITAEAHREVMAQVEPGWAEYEIEALIEYTFKRNGAEEPGFPSIVGSGENSVILHYESNRRTTKPGDVIVIDIGAEYHGYSADVTRTIPVDGRFTPEQRAIYEIVLAAQEAGIAATRAGNMFFAPHQAAQQVLARGLADLGLIRNASDGAGLRRFFMHGTSHYLGLDVHDVGSGGPMAPGTVITVEPGIYIAAADDIDPKWWNIGVRIEDDVLVTESGPVMLSAGAPRTVADIERVMGAR